MHHAPSVNYPVGRSSWSGWILLALWGGATASCVAWFATGAAGWRGALAVVATVATGAWAGWAWWRQPAGRLDWDGAHWTLQGERRLPGGPGVLRPALDLQQVLLVRWTGPAGTRWYWLDRDWQPERWSALRRAVYSRAEQEDAPPGAEPPSARP
ncbi:MAG TPA: hypothetical protein VFE82_17735 [Ramlibacter sp.]|jgi:hypothetical protein|uniref:hypothetical protein n=1 Tax=Ramlibacter sp. TaxID=1917967 RepID=UPI002D24543D|nr:hypothetical protein [Ramlibacter sp.]HZY20316.1 hypothetical protein [Ramlibacter sp.]